MPHDSCDGTPARVEPQGKPLTWAGGYAAGRDSVLRKNVSGCCCKLDEQGDELLEPCALHAAWRDSAVSARVPNADTARLDWLERREYGLMKQPNLCAFDVVLVLSDDPPVFVYELNGVKTPDLRDAIDTALLHRADDRGVTP